MVQGRRFATATVKSMSFFFNKRTPRAPKNTSRIAKRFGVVGGVITCFTIYVAFFGIGPYDIPSRSRDLHGLIEESKRLGLPMTQQDLKPKTEVPDEENAALEVVRLAAEISKISRPNDFSYFDKGTDEREQIERAVQTVSPLLDEIIEEIATKPGWFIDRDYDMGMLLNFDEYPDSKEVAKYLAMRAYLSAERNDVEGALIDLTACRTLRIRIVKDPTVIALLVACAIDAIAQRACEQIVTLWEDDPQALARLEEALAKTDHVLDPRNALRGEFYFSLSTIRNLEVFGGWKELGDSMDGGEPIEFDPDSLQRTGLPKGMFAKAFASGFVEEWNIVFRSFEDAQEPPRGWGKKTDDRSEAMGEKFKASEILVQILMPVFGRVDISLSQNDANQELTKALVRVVRFRAENGRLPESLEEAGAAFPDTFNNGNPIKAILTEDEVRIWSIGPNGVDDQGLPRHRDHKERDDFSIYWPAGERISS